MAKFKKRSVSNLVFVGQTSDPLANLLKTRRLQLGKKLSEIAAELGVDRSTISRWERGDTKSLNPGLIKRLAMAYQLPVEQLEPYERYCLICNKKACPLTV